MSNVYRTWAEINLDNLVDNFNSIRKFVDKKTKIMSVIKADAYGHGCLQCAEKLIESGTDYFAVSCVDEALQLCRNGVNIPTLILGYTPIEAVEELLNYNIIFTVTDVDFAEKLSSKAIELNTKAKIHIKIDAGMGRIGFLYNYGKQQDCETLRNIEYISKLEGIDAEGIFTHFPNADDADVSKTERHFNLFNELISELENRGIFFKIRHCCNSAATMRFPHMHMDMVRPGIILYGCLPSKECENKEIDLKPVMTLKTKVVHIKEIGKGHPISYGGDFVTKNDTKIATLPIGYADGFSRALGNRYCVLANNKRVPILGKICMDQCMIDITDVNNISVGDEVVIFGGSIPVEEYSLLNNTINYETLCLIGIRVPRVYFIDGKQIKVLNFLV